MLEPGEQQMKRGKCSSARCAIEAPRSDSQKRQFHWSQIAYAVPFLGAIAKAKSDGQLRHVCLSVRLEQLGSHETDFN
jgi:hypothetical protein